MFLIYLDQNYASHFARHLLGEANHEPFDILYEHLLSYEAVCPASPFHVLELRGGYLAPVFQTFFPKIQQGLWIRQWQDVLARQRQHQRLDRQDLLTQDGSWEDPADLTDIAWIATHPLEGHLNKRVKQARAALSSHFDLEEHEHPLPFVETLAWLMAFRSMNEQRQPRGSDLADMLIAATTQPYVDILATDRFVAEAFLRRGLGDGVYSGRRHHALALIEDLKQRFVAPPSSGPTE